jgi:hypothetical protein
MLEGMESAAQWQYVGSVGSGRVLTLLAIVDYALGVWEVFAAGTVRVGGTA